MPTERKIARTLREIQAQLDAMREFQDYMNEEFDLEQKCAAHRTYNPDLTEEEW